MNNIKSIFKKGKAFIPFITCGDPNLEITEQLVYALEEAGADLVELGIPFSDPVAEGLTIQDANLRALNGGVTTDKIFAMVEKIRIKSNIPLAFMTYANVVFSYGIDKFMNKSGQLGIDALILPDVPFEEKNEFEPICQKYNITFISLITPVSKDRISMISAEAKGFIYCVSSLGVTGTRGTISADIGSIIESIKQVNNIPCAIGFGVSTPEQAKTMAGLGDGVIVGSAIVGLCKQHGVNCVPYVKDFVYDMVCQVKGDN